MDLAETGRRGVDWIYLALVKEWLAVWKALMIIRFQMNAWRTVTR